LSFASEMGWNPGEPLFLTVGALIARKNFSWLVSLMKEWRGKGSPGSWSSSGKGRSEIDWKSPCAAKDWKSAFAYAGAWGKKPC